MNLPSILKSNTTKENWSERRNEILKLFKENVYGEIPQFTFDKIFTLQIQEHILKNNIVFEKHLLCFEKDDISMSFSYEIYRDENLKKSSPVIIMIDPFSNNEKLKHNAKRMSEFFPFDIITKQGYIAIKLNVGEICKDCNVLCNDGIMRFLNKKNNVGVIGIWAYLTSCFIDTLFEKKEMFDCDKIAVCGFSRAGKTALWCAALDERVAAVISNASGCTGAAITRGKTGEHISDITSTFPHWFCGKYSEYSDNEDALPLDQHMLLALCAPRPLYVSSSSLDTWADPKSEFKSCVLTSEIYEFSDASGLNSITFPNENTPIMDGDIAYHVRTGEHACTKYDWECYLAFLQKYFN